MIQLTTVIYSGGNVGNFTINVIMESFGNKVLSLTSEINVVPSRTKSLCDIPSDTFGYDGVCGCDEESEEYPYVKLPCGISTFEEYTESSYFHFSIVTFIFSVFSIFYPCIGRGILSVKLY